MGKSVKETHNLDGSVRTETTYTYKDGLGVRHSSTYVTKQTAEERQRQIEQQAASNARMIKAILIVVALFIIAIMIMFAIY